MQTTNTNPQPLSFHITQRLATNDRNNWKDCTLCNYGPFSTAEEARLAAQALMSTSFWLLIYTGNQVHATWSSEDVPYCARKSWNLPSGACKEIFQQITHAYEHALC